MSEDGWGSSHHDKVLQAVGFVAGTLLRSTSWRRVARVVLGTLGRSTGVSRAYVFENHHDEDGRLLVSQRYEWTAPGIAPQIENPTLQGIRYGDAGFLRWKDTLGAGRMIRGRVLEFPAAEQSLLHAQGIRAVLVAPVFERGAWWGFLGFDECAEDRRWTSSEVEALSIAADLLGAALERERREDAARQRGERYAQASIAGGTGAWEWDLLTDEMWVDPALKALLGYRDDEVRNHLDEWGDLVHPDDRALVRAATERHLSGDAPRFEVEHRMIHRDGSVRWFLARGIARRDPSGRPVRMLGSDVDVTARRRNVGAATIPETGAAPRRK